MLNRKMLKISFALAVIAGAVGIVLVLNKQSATDVETLAKQAHEALKMQDFQTVAELSKQILAIEPNHAETFAHLGMLHFAMGESKGAIDFFDRALAIDPDNRDAKMFKTMVQASGKEGK